MFNEESAEKRKIKKLATEQVKDLTKKLIGDSDWTILQIILQEILSTYICRDEKTPTLDNMVILLNNEVAARYADNEQVRNILLAGIPTKVSISQWLKKDGWDDAVWKHIKATGMFTNEKRAAIIDALYKRGKDKSDTAAKLWLTMSGDFSEHLNVHTDNTIDQFRDIQQALLSKKRTNES